MRAALICLLLCCALSAQTAPGHSPALVLLPGAAHVDFPNSLCDRVRYQLARKYPAAASVRAIQRALKSQGWKPLKRDYLRETPLSARWQHPGNSSIYRRELQWTKHDRDIAAYTFRFEDIFTRAAKQQVLFVEAAYCTADEVKKVKRLELPH